MTSRTAPRIIGALIGFVGLSVVAGLLAAMLVVPSLSVAGEGLVTAADTFNALPSYLKITQPAQASAIYAKQGKQDVKIATFYVQNRTDVALDQISKVMTQAAVDTEDPRFYKEGAIDVQGTVRGALATTLGHDVQGGSSITQQYVKNVLVQRCAQEYDLNTPAGKVDANKCYDQVTATTPARKLREMRYAIGVQKKYSKDDILRSYLNLVGFGGTIYGIQAASEYYFGVPAKSLSLVQAATLTAIINNPANLRIDHPSDAKNGKANGYALTKARRDYVLRSMHKAGDITAAQLNEGQRTPIQPRITQQSNGCASAAKYDAGYFCKYVELSIASDPSFGKTAADRIATLTEGGLSIHTTLNLDLQKTSQQAVSAYMPTSVPGMNVGASSTAVEPGSGRIITMVQNTTFNEVKTSDPGSTSVNYNSDYSLGGSQGFQTGSSFKAFTLAAWLEAGHTLNQTVSTTEHHFMDAEFTNSCVGMANDPWPVSNADPAPASMTVLAATADSVNTAFAQMGKQLDLCNIKDVAYGMGIHPADPAANGFTIVPPMILGTNYIAPLTMATAYAGMANHGVVCTPIAIDSITDATGKSLPVSKTKCTQGMPQDIAAGVDYALQNVLKPGGTGANANPNDGVPIIAKTGTTDAAVQNWLVTSTTRIAQATWVGNISGKVGFYNAYVNGVNGYQLKFGMDKIIIAALNAAYHGGDAFPAPPQSEIGYVQRPVIKGHSSGSKDSDSKSGKTSGTNSGGISGGPKNGTPGKQ
ncbi:carboxypeptidase [Frondihabitans sucicola]|uniref:Carboxypeptidase n=1 Tax=Frondihabitans sucicola TaxID=1268041 RepID=A0ABN6Y598_9MICO|nr:transglycosylase domain-containing protein [Frondihabitans sucicola]BDZ52206.1 carboxypeptidase [Frondihabitans sucicola]